MVWRFPVFISIINIARHDGLYPLFLAAPCCVRDFSQPELLIVEHNHSFKHCTSQPLSYRTDCYSRITLLNTTSSKLSQCAPPKLQGWCKGTKLGSVRSNRTLHCEIKEGNEDKIKSYTQSIYHSKGSFKYYVINILAFFPPLPPSVIKRNHG